MALRIRRIRIENFRKLAGPVELSGFGDGLTVIAGDNEDGKSTVLEAIRAALFCRHRAGGDYVKSLAPFGSRGVRPRVELDFVIDGAPYRLRKAFCPDSRQTELAADGTTFQGDEAEEELARVLGFTPARKGAPKAEEQGVWGLFWVEQGTTFVCDRRIGDAGRATLMGALEDEMGRVLGGEAGRVLLEKVRLRHDELFTESKGQAKKGSELAVARVWRGEAEKRVSDLEREAASLQEKLAELERLRAERQALEREQRLSRAEQALRDAELDDQRIDALRRRQQEAHVAEQLARARMDAAQTASRQREALMLAAQAATETRVQVSAALEIERERSIPLRAALASADAEVEAARRGQSVAAADLDAAQRQERRSRESAELAAATAALAKARAAHIAAEAARAEAGAIRIDDDALTELRELASLADRARAQLEAAETVLQFAPEPGRRIFLGDQEVDPAAPLRITAEITLQLEGFGDLTVRPGGQDLRKRQQHAERATAGLQAALARLDVADLNAATAAHGRRREQLAAAVAEDRMRAACAPDGIDALHERIHELQASLADLDDGSVPLPGAKASAALEQARIARADAERAVVACEQQRQKIAAAWAEADRALVDLEARRDGAQRLSEERGRELASARTIVADETLAEALRSEEKTFADAALLLKQADRELAATDPAAAATRLAVARQMLVEVTTNLKQVEQGIRELEIELRTLGQSGIEEELDQARGDLDRARRQAAAVEARAAALRLLHDTLRGTEAEARQSFAAPIATRMAPYLRELFPGSELEFASDTLQPQLLRRDGIEEPLASLSVGAREQLAVLTRLAFAELLLDRGQPAALILDDALVYSDRKRLKRMQEVLLRAAERLQILVLTCREDDYAGLAPVLRLDGRPSAPAASREPGRAIS